MGSRGGEDAGDGRAPRREWAKARERRLEALHFFSTVSSGLFPHTHCRNTRVCGGDSKIFGSISRFASCKLPRLGAHSRGVSRFSPRSLPPMSAALAVRQHRTTAPFAAVFSFLPRSFSSADFRLAPAGSSARAAHSVERRRTVATGARSSAALRSIAARSARVVRGAATLGKRVGRRCPSPSGNARARARASIAETMPAAGLVARGATLASTSAARDARPRRLARASAKPARGSSEVRRATRSRADSGRARERSVSGTRASSESTIIGGFSSLGPPPSPRTRRARSTLPASSLTSSTPPPFLSFASTLHHDRALVVRGGSAPYPAPRCSPRTTPPPRPPPRPISSRTRPPAAAAWAAASPTRSPSPTPPRTPR